MSRLGCVGGVHDDLHVAGRPDLQAVDREQGEGDVAEPLRDLAEFGDEQGIAGEVDGVWKADRARRGLAAAGRQSESGQEGCDIAFAAGATMSHPVRFRCRTE
jgi:hypothetical protein